jgi:hypothetical protein
VRAGTTSPRAEGRRVAIEHDALLMRIYLSESRYRSAIVESMLAHGLRGAAAFKGIGGFGASRRVSSERAVDALADLPVVIEVVDDEAKVRAFVPVLETLLPGGLVTLERIQRVVYRPGAGA